MKSQIEKSRTKHLTVETMIDVEDSCWKFITLLWKLDVIEYDSDIDDPFDSVRYGHQRDIVEMWHQLYLEQDFMRKK